jgi:hypothetical protein
MAARKRSQGSDNGSDWRRVPGKARRYKNAKTGEEISRRQFVQRFGKARSFGTLEKRARFNRQQNEAEALLHPARGRKKATHLTGGEREAELGRRRVARKESAADKKIARIQAKRKSYPQTISIRSFKKGRLSREIELPIAYEPIEEVRQAAARSKIVWGYFVGVNLITTMGELRRYVPHGMQHINKVFKELSYQKMMEHAQSLSYATIVSLFIHLSLLEEIAQKRNGWKKRGHRI